jgi:taurine dioxygenase
MRVTEISGKTIGASISNIDLATVTNEDIHAIKGLVYDRRGITIKNQNLSPLEFIRFGNKIGEVQPYFQENYHHPEHPEIFVSSNVKRNGVQMGVDRTGGYWHTDTAFQAKPSIFTILSPQLLPRIRRTTLFLDMAAAYRKLRPEWQHFLDRSTAVHSGRWRYKVRTEDTGKDISEILSMVDSMAPPARHPAVIVHPITEEKSLYLSSGFTIRLEGDVLPFDGPTFLNDLFDNIERDENVQEATWHIGDIIIWDNRLVCHRSGRLTEVPGTEPSELSSGETMMFRLTAFDSTPLSLRTPQGPHYSGKAIVNWRTL